MNRRRESRYEREREAAHIWSYYNEGMGAVLLEVADKVEAEMIELKPGDMVIVVTNVEPNGSNKRRLFRYDTAASWHESGLEIGSYTRTREEWDGKEYVDLDNGD